MDIILKTDIAGLGYKNDLISVKPGYGRNYLIPQGYAQLATESNRKILAENLKQAAHKAEKNQNCRFDNGRRNWRNGYYYFDEDWRKR